MYVGQMSLEAGNITQLMFGEFSVMGVPLVCWAAGPFVCLGMLWAFLTGLSAMKAIALRYFMPAVSLKRYGAGSGSWAVVTGASDGIGKAYAMELAKRKFNVLLLSRTESKLQAVAKEIQDKHKGVEVAYYAVDFSRTDVYEAIARKIEKDCSPVGVLVNNVGMNFVAPQRFLESSEDETRNIVNCNIVSLNEMTRICLPGMLQRKAGAIINMSSFTGVIPTPMLSTYSATKAYINYMSVCLNTEYSSKGVSCMAVVPAFVVSSMSKMRKSTMVAAPEEIVRCSLNNIGRIVTYSPNLVHTLMEWVMTRESLLGYVQGMTLSQNIGIAAAAKRKRERMEKSK